MNAKRVTQPHCDRVTRFTRLEVQATLLVAKCHSLLGALYVAEVPTLVCVQLGAS